MNREALLHTYFFYQGVNINLVRWELCGNQAIGGDSLLLLVVVVGLFNIKMCFVCTFRSLH